MDVGDGDFPHVFVAFTVKRLRGELGNGVRDATLGEAFFKALERHVLPCVGGDKGVHTTGHAGRATERFKGTDGGVAVLALQSVGGGSQVEMDGFQHTVVGNVCASHGLQHVEHFLGAQALSEHRCGEVVIVAIA